MKSESLANKSQAFLHYLETWTSALPPLPMAEASADPSRTAVISVDVIHGFCYEGPLSSPRVAGIVEPIVHLFERSYEHGVRNFILAQDTHEPEAVEFAQWPVHCVRGTAESETVSEFKALPFFDQMLVMEKNSIAAGLDTALDGWLADHPDVDTFIVVGDCTDLCTYQLAMYLRLDANARQITRRVIVPADCVQTYDMPVDTALGMGIMPHPGDLLHSLFLYHMQLNGVEVAAQIQ